MTVGGAPQDNDRNGLVLLIIIFKGIASLQKSVVGQQVR